ncbi:hypothetical protein, conserved [Leishmania shawi]|uniref:Uncharacterized protein n=1 Tax=Leishmania shawi TaxID=5680 RepID=A0ABR3EC86_9TRYP
MRAPVARRGGPCTRMAPVLFSSCWPGCWISSTSPSCCCCPRTATQLRVEKGRRTRLRSDRMNIKRRRGRLDGSAAPPQEHPRGGAGGADVRAGEEGRGALRVRASASAPLPLSFRRTALGVLLACLLCLRSRMCVRWAARACRKCDEGCAEARPALSRRPRVLVVAHLDCALRVAVRASACRRRAPPCAPSRLSPGWPAPPLPIPAFVAHTTLALCCRSASAPLLL